MRIRGARIVSGGEVLENRDIVTRGGIITSVEPHDALQRADADLDGLYLAPGFTDLHCHGGNGFEFIDATEEAFYEACRLHAEGGTRILYPTLSASDYETTLRFLETAKRVRKDMPLRIPGVHLEGPYLAKSMCGAQDTSYITPPIREQYTHILDTYGDLIARWSYAPETDDGSFQRELNRRGVAGAMAHTAAEYADVVRAHDLGCNLITHLYSCTSSIVRKGGFRVLGVTECAYLFDDMYAEAIGDGCHIPPELMRLIVKQKTPDRVCLITDAIRFAGMKNAENLQGGTKTVPYLIEDGVAKLSDRSAFAGSIATTGDVLRRTLQAGISLADTVTMLTRTPARAMGKVQQGEIAEGNPAVFTVFDSKGNIINML